MEQEELIDNLLQMLFEEYTVNGVTRCNFSSYVHEQGFDPNEIGNFMNKRGLLRQFQLGSGFIAAISERGISKVDSNFLSEKAEQVLNHARNNDNKTTVGDAITLPNDYGGMAHDIGKYIQDRKLAATQSRQYDVAIFIN